MNWIDYRKKLGIGFCDEDKMAMLTNKIVNLINYLCSTLGASDYHSPSFIDYYTLVGEVPKNQNLSNICESMKKANSMEDLISKYVAFSNTAHKHISNTNVVEVIHNFLPSELCNLNIQYEVINDEDGTFVFPKGAKELDDALVSQPLEWLKDYPKAYKTFCIALKQYSEGEYIRDTADNLRKALEEFLQEFLGNNKNLETNKNEICKWLGLQGVDSGISGMFQPLIGAYKNINDRIAKHNDMVDKKLLEFLLYQTGVLIRMVIVVKGGQR